MSQSAIRLVKSLSGSEKRLFRLNTRQHSGTRDYLDLFDIIDKSSSTDAQAIRRKFLAAHPSSSADNAARYLIKVLTDCLIQSKAEKDPFFSSLQGLMRVKILQERSLAEESYRETKKIRKASQNFHQHFIEYLTYRGELNYLGERNFPGVNDKLLIGMQMKGREILKRMNQVHEHYTLLELLKLRLLESGKVSSDEDKKRLNDLILTEMTLVAGRSKNSFVEQKLHLMFQSFFFTHIGDYQSALKTFHALNKLFEQHISMLNHPPLDYLSALNGILDSLHALKYFDEIPFYLGKLAQLDQPEYPEYFRYQVKKTIAVYQLAALTGTSRFEEAVAYLSSLDAGLLTNYAILDEEKQWELYYYCSLSCFGTGDLKQAHDFISRVMHNHKMHPQLMVCKAARLLNILVYYEKGENEYLEYEIRSYRRFFQPVHKLLKSEHLLFRFIKLWPDRKRKTIPALPLKKLTAEVDAIEKDVYERQLLKYFDHVEWIKSRISS